MKAMITKIPFCGFYESALDRAIDHEIEMLAYNLVVDGSNDGDEPDFPEAVRLDEREIMEAVYAGRAADFGHARIDMAKAYVAIFSDEAGARLDMDLKLEFEGFTSPQYYNFETDRLFGFIPSAVVAVLFEMSASESHRTLERVIRDRFTSRDGFWSHYSNELDEWLEKPLADWDHNEVETLLVAALYKADGERTGFLPGDGRHGDPVLDIQGETEQTVLEVWSENYGFDECVDWKEFDAERARLRAPKLEALYETDPDQAGKVWAELCERHPETAAVVADEMDVSAVQGVMDIAAGLPARCPATADLFIAEGEAR